MARLQRSRNRSRQISGAVDTYVEGSYYSTSPYSITQASSISDYTGRPVVPSPLTSNQHVGELVVDGGVTSLYGRSRESYKFYHFPVMPSSAGVNTAVLGAPSGWYLDVVARTNPSRPVVTPLTLLQDLVELPRQLFQLGKLITKPRGAMTPKEASSHYLCAQFGWAPLIEDVKHLLNLQAYTQKRVKELHRLYSGRGLSRRVSFSNDTQNIAAQFRYPLYGTDNRVIFLYDVTVKRKSWATIRWRPSDVPSYRPSDEEMSQLAFRAVSGLTVEGLAKGAWDVIPWTWLLGWFTNVGKFALAYSNTVPATHGASCFMSESARTYVAKGVSGVGVSNNTLSFSGTWRATTKTRLVSGSLVPGFNMPFLSMFRLSILTALFTQRTR